MFSEVVGVIELSMGVLQAKELRVTEEGNSQLGFELGVAAL